MSEERVRKRRRTGLLTAVMLLGAVWTGAVLILYPLGHFYFVNWFFESPARTCIVSLGEGHALAYSFTHPPIVGASSGLRRELVSRAKDPGAFGGFKWWFEKVARPTSTAYIVPLWAIGLVGALPTALAWWRRSAVRRGSCPKCGYDTRGLTHAACPKCGRTLGI